MVSTCVPCTRSSNSLDRLGVASPWGRPRAERRRARGVRLEVSGAGWRARSLKEPILRNNFDSESTPGESGVESGAISSETPPISGADRPPDAPSGPSGPAAASPKARRGRRGAFQMRPRPKRPSRPPRHRLAARHAHAHPPASPSPAQRERGEVRCTDQRTASWG